MRMFFYRRLDDSGVVVYSSWRPLLQSELGIKLIGDTNDIPGDTQIRIDTLEIATVIPSASTMVSTESVLNESDLGDYFYRSDIEEFLVCTMQNGVYRLEYSGIPMPPELPGSGNGGGNNGGDVPDALTVTASVDLASGVTLKSILLYRVGSGAPEYVLSRRTPAVLQGGGEWFLPSGLLVNGNYRLIVNFNGNGVNMPVEIPMTAATVGKTAFVTWANNGAFSSGGDFGAL